MANLAYGIPFTTDTRTNIGSTSKQFTAFAIMLQAERGALSLDDDIRKHIPELPEFDETITVRHLITHTSGLREFLNLLLMTGRRLDHGDWIDRAEIIDIVQRQPALQNAPGAEFNYNNTAFGLAAADRRAHLGPGLPRVPAENVFEPLDMTRSMVRPDPEQIVPESSEGYTPGAGRLPADRRSGRRSRCRRHLHHGRGSAAVGAELRGPAGRQRGDRQGDDDPVRADRTARRPATATACSSTSSVACKRVQHGGADVAHRSMLVYYPEINAGLTVQSNHASVQLRTWPSSWPRPSSATRWNPCQTLTEGGIGRGLRPGELRSRGLRRVRRPVRARRGARLHSRRSRARARRSTPRPPASSGSRSCRPRRRRSRCSGSRRR